MAEIISNVFNKGEIRNPSTNFELVDIHANYDSTKQAQTAIGGFFQQFYYVIAAILEHYGDDLSDYYQRRQDDPQGVNAAKTVRELMIE